MPKVTSEAEEDYANWNQEFAEGNECTREEFKDFLELEDNSFLIGGTENATTQNQIAWMNEIDEKLIEIFGEEEE
ncbi:hypothetical protein [Rossellomorea yichunensis]|uniref:hypothetical protein n=1 Tax=Rossellomorea yichunensis TaxID=3077331 RepID=UPI0028E09EC0|nr:hypothetical protein [Rossellomorea sp. YC4-1]MDT9027458.1 hypothetical protein [Rossellomorea sp. YC4-1]